MNVILLTVENLRYDTLFDKSINKIILDTFNYQSSVFHNFRLPSPKANINYNILSCQFDEIEHTVWHSSDYLMQEDVDHFDKIDPSEPFILWKHWPHNETGKGYSYHVERTQIVLKNMMEFFQDKGLLKDTAIIFTSLNGHDEDMSNPLSDNHLRVPLTIFHPDFEKKNVTNSVTLRNIVPTINELYTGENHIELKDNGDKINWSLVDIIKKDMVKNRFDVYSKYENRYGLRGPMFQYYCDYDPKQGKVVLQELYDLNNDYEMKNNLIKRSETLSTQVIHLINEYRKRILAMI